MRLKLLLFFTSWVTIAAPLAERVQPRSEREGESLFRATRFKAAARRFEDALRVSDNSARLHFWAGRSYARLAEATSPVCARSNARKAQIHLEAAVRLEPANPQYVLELFDFYVNSPEWLEGGLDRAALLLERIGPDDGGPATPSKRLADARSEFKGPEWQFEKGILRLGALVDRILPLR